MDEEDNNVIDNKKLIVTDELVNNWKNKIKSEIKNGVFVSKVSISEELEKRLFLMKYSKITDTDYIYETYFENTWFIHKVPRNATGFTLSIDKKKNAFCQWLLKPSNAPGSENKEKQEKNKDQSIINQSTINQPIVERTIKRRKLSENDFGASNQNVEFSDSPERGKIQESNIVKQAMAGDWLKIKISQEAKEFFPYEGQPPNFSNDNIPPELSNEDIFGITKLWIDHLKAGDNWSYYDTYFELKKSDTNIQLKSPQIMIWLKALNEEVIIQRRTHMVIMTIFNTLARRLAGIKALENRELMVKESNAKKIVELEKQTNVIKEQLGSSMLADGKKVITVSKKLGRFSIIRKKNAERNIANYKKKNDWVEENEWKKLTVFQRIMKRWVFTDFHQCLTPWDESKLSDEELRIFHEKKKIWRGNRREEIVKNAKNYRWLLRRFDRFCHCRIIGNRIWLGLDASYDDFIGVSKRFKNISWKFYKRRTYNNWRFWSYKRKNKYDDQSNPEDEYDQQNRYWGMEQEWDERNDNIENNINNINNINNEIVTSVQKNIN
jgi:hypothetical protein